MNSIGELKQIEQTKLSEIFKECGVFWAFSNEQFEENKTTLEEGDTYVSIGAGGYIPKSKKDLYKNKSIELNAWYRLEVSNMENGIEKEIEYELCNHECYYTGDIDVVVDIFSGIYTVKQILEVYHKTNYKYD